MSEPKILEKIPSEQKLQQLVAGGPDTMDIAIQLIEKFKLPFIIENGGLRSVYSQGELFLQQFITIDPSTIAMKEDANKMAKSPYAVLICGETGTGKELIAKSMIADRKGPIKSVNCAGFPRELIESELFGHVRGAFSGANENRDGLMALATGGVMFMDEIGELPMDVQSKLLRVLQDHKVRKVGSKVEEDINCKFVFATNRDLRKMIDAGTFRKDLYARISALELFIPSLNERKCDIVPILESMNGGKAFLEKYGNDLELLDISLNVRSLQQWVIRYNVLGRLKIER